MIWSLDSTLISRALAKERLDLILKGVLVHHACVRLGNLPVAVNEQSHRERGESPVSGREVLVGDHDWIIQLVLFENGFTDFQPSSSMETPNRRQSVVLVLILELHVPRNLNFAAAAPSSPEVEQDYFPFISGQFDGRASGVAENEVGAGCPTWGAGCAG